MDFAAGTDRSRLLRERFAAGMPAGEVVEIAAAVADATGLCA